MPAEATAAVAAVTGRRVTLSASLLELAIQDRDRAAAAACATMWSCILKIKQNASECENMIQMM